MRVSIRLQHRLWIALLVVLALGGVARRAEASENMRGDKCEVTADREIKDDFYFFCRILDVKGTIDGDLIGVASSVTIHAGAVITGDIWVGGGQLIIAGTVADDIHFGGVSVVIEQGARFLNPLDETPSDPHRMDVLSVALNTEIAPHASYPGDVQVWGYQAQIDGMVGGDLTFRGEALTINGIVVGMVDADVGDIRRNTDVPSLPFYDVTFSDPGLRVGDDAHIAGDLEYTATRPSPPDMLPSGVVQGRTRYTRTGAQPDITKVDQANDAAEIIRGYLSATINDVATLLILGVIGLRFIPGIIRQPATHVRRRTVPTIGWGLLTFMLSIPLVITVIMIGLIFLLILYLVQLNQLTIMVGATVLIVTAVLVGVITFLLFFMGRLVVSFMIGQLIYRYALRQTKQGTLRHWLTILLLGTTVYALIINMPIPALGLVIELITALAGVGAVVMHIRRRIMDLNLFTPLPDPLADVPISTISVMIPTQPQNDAGQQPGMNNLPNGFKGFDEDW
ncbi:MAG: hypothetical protein K8S97_00310 [Anaerolineae bacterium]|nr:hypothetical protein [Anaerolineae bacterium]